MLDACTINTCGLLSAMMSTTCAGSQEPDAISTATHNAYLVVHAFARGASAVAAQHCITMSTDPAALERNFGHSGYSMHMPGLLPSGAVREREGNSAIEGTPWVCTAPDLTPLPEPRPPPKPPAPAKPPKPRLKPPASPPSNRGKRMSRAELQQPRPFQLQPCKLCPCRHSKTNLDRRPQTLLCYGVCFYILWR